MRVLGLTGGIGSGKSFVGRIFNELGAEVIDADQLARDVVEPGQPALREIAAAFGPEVLLPNGRLNRSRLGDIVFADAPARAALNAITHPRIRQRMAEDVAARQGKEGVLILDIPLLFENARLDMVEAVIVVWVDPETQLRRLTERDGLSLEDARRRVDAQMPLEEKRRRADHVIDNSGSPEATRGQVEAVYRRYRPGAGAALPPA
jgi:dephospho-CoA kinase